MTEPVESAWYVIQVNPMTAKRIEKNIREMISAPGSQIYDIAVPKEARKAVGTSGKLVESAVYPGYLFINALATEDCAEKLGSMLRQFKSPWPKFQRLSETEAKRIIQEAAEPQKPRRLSDHFAIGNKVLVSDGPFANFNGEITHVIESKQTAKVEVSIFGRLTAVEVKLADLQRLE